MNNEWSSKPWKYTDDILGGIIVVAYIVQNKLGLTVPDWALASTLLWLFGSRVMDFLKSIKG